MAPRACESCGLPVESGMYCRRCTNENGTLQSFEERLSGLTEFILSRSPGLDRAMAEARARVYMRMMPAWRDRPELAK